MQTTIDEKHAENFGETIKQIGLLYQYNHELENALYSFI